MIRTLHVDIEGGWGGSSRSLYELVKRFDRTRIEPVVAHRQSGPIEGLYRDIDVPLVHIPEIASFLPRPGVGKKMLIVKAPELMGLWRGARRLIETARKYRTQLIHLNYEGLFLLAPLLRRKLGIPIVCHCRAASMADDFLGRWLVNQLCRNVDHLFFIGPVEERRIRSMSRGRAIPGDVLWNIAPEPVPRRPLDAVPEIVYLGGIDPIKGTDRLFDVAVELEKIQAPPMIMAVYGNSRFKKGFDKDLKQKVDSAGLQHRIAFRGHTSEPMQALAGAMALLRTSRLNDPWGRDVIEAITMGVPVLATGTFDKIVEPGVNGYLFESFDARSVAERLVELAANKTLWQRLSRAAREKGEIEYSGKRQIHVVTRVFERLAGNGEKRQGEQ